MFSLMGATLTGYLLRVCRDVANRNPRFRHAMGDATFANNSLLQYRDLQVIVKDVTADGHRLSPNNFMYTQLGKATVAKINGKEGQFIEWATEVDPTGQLLDPGVYYIGIDWIKDSNATVPEIPEDAETGEIGLTLEKYKWRQGTVRDAAGSIVAFRTGINATTVTAFDPSTGEPVLCQATATTLQLLAATQTLGVRDAAGANLVPMVDFWIQREGSAVIIESTQFGTQDVNLPTGFLTMAIVDQDDYTLRSGIDYIFVTANRIRLSDWTVAGTTLSVKGVQQIDPTVAGNCMNPENTLDFRLLPGETLVPKQLLISTQDGDNIPVTINADGTVTLPTPLPVGGWCTYDVRISAGSTTHRARRNGITQTVIPGLHIAIGDSVEVDDQCAVIVSPQTTETYEVFGSQEGVSATIEIRANDINTASALANEIRARLFVTGRLQMESDGLVPYEGSVSSSSQGRDTTGVAATHVFSISFSGAADWRIFVPLVTRVTNFNVTTSPQLPPVKGRPTQTPMYRALGMSGFLPDYR